MVVQMTIRPSVEFVATDMLEQFPTFATHEALRVPSLTHGTDDPANDGVGAPGTDDGGSRVNSSGRGLRGEGNGGRCVESGDRDGRKSGKDNFWLVNADRG